MCCWSNGRVCAVAAQQGNTSMFKLVILTCLIGFVVSQNLAQMMMLSQMFDSQAGGAGATGTGTTGATGTGTDPAGATIDPTQAALLCRQTDHFRPIPCRNSPFVCDMLSMRSYNMPGLLACSPMGFGCCIKDMMSLIMIQRSA